jgi:carbonic anhydrase
MNSEIPIYSIVDVNAANDVYYPSPITLESTAISPNGMIRCLEIDPLLGEAPDCQANVSPDAAIETLYEGNRRFVEHRVIHPHEDTFRFEEVAKGQNPFATILGCSDSRVSLELIFDQGLGDIFVTRNAGNVVTDTVMGTIEYGAFVLGTKVVFVLGHCRCGAIKGAVQNIKLPGKIHCLLDLIKPAVISTKDLPGDPLTNTSIANIQYQIRKLESSPVLSELVAMGELKIVGGFYDLDTGIVTPV